MKRSKKDRIAELEAQILFTAGILEESQAELDEANRKLRLYEEALAEVSTRFERMAFITYRSPR